MRFRNKKAAIEMDFLVRAVIIIIVLVVLLYFLLTNTNILKKTANCEERNGYCELAKTTCKEGTTKTTLFSCGDFAKDHNREKDDFKCCVQTSPDIGSVELDNYRKSVEKKIGSGSGGTGVAGGGTSGTTPGTTPGSGGEESGISISTWTALDGNLLVNKPLALDKGNNVIGVKIAGGSRKCKWFITRRTGDTSQTINPGAEMQMTDNRESSITINANDVLISQITSNPGEIWFNFVCFKEGSTQWDASTANPLVMRCGDLNSVVQMVASVRDDNTRLVSFSCSDPDAEGCNCNKVYYYIGYIPSAGACPVYDASRYKTITTTSTISYTRDDNIACAVAEDDLGRKTAPSKLDLESALNLVIFKGDSIFYDSSILSMPTLYVADGETVNLNVQLRGASSGEQISHGWFICTDTLPVDCVVVNEGASYTSYTGMTNVNFRIEGDLKTYLSIGKPVTLYYITLEAGYNVPPPLWNHPLGDWEPKAYAAIPVALQP